MDKELGKKKKKNAHSINSMAFHPHDTSSSEGRRGKIKRFLSFRKVKIPQQRRAKGASSSDNNTKESTWRTMRPWLSFAAGLVAKCVGCVELKGQRGEILAGKLTLETSPQPLGDVGGGSVVSLRV